MNEVEQAAWSSWFDAQWELTREFDRLFDARVSGRSDTFKAATCSAMVEHFSEKQRRFMTLPASDVGTSEGASDE